MKKFLLCTLNDENYTEPDFEFFDTQEEAEKRCIEVGKEFCEEGSYEMTVTYQPLSCDSPLRYDFKYGEHFVVNFIFELPEVGEFLCIWHHAYDGVDFSVEKSGTLEECQKKMKEEKSCVLQTLYSTLDFEEADRCCIDTGEEWEVWHVIKRE